MTELALVPAASLTQESLSKERPNRFILFSHSWLHLQDYVQTSLLLPITSADFEKRYGGFDKQGLVKSAVDAMRDLQALSSQFGNPTTLKDRIAHDVDYLFTPAPPDEIYGHIVWLAMQIQDAASTFKHTMVNLQRLIGTQAGTRDERAAFVKALLVGPGSLAARAADMQAKTRMLIDKLTAFERKISSANDKMLVYTSQESDLLKYANRLAGEYKDKIDNELKPASAAAWKAWLGYTIAAVTASVTLVTAGLLTLFLAPVTFGATLTVTTGLVAGGVLAAAALGAAAAYQRGVYNSLLDQITATEAAQQLKIALVSDLTALNDKIGGVGTGLKDFKDKLSVIEGIWLDVGGRLTHICQNYSAAQLSDLPWLMQAFSIADAADKWGEIATTTQEFTQNSLVDYESRPFGERIPEPAAERVAA